MKKLFSAFLAFVGLRVAYAQDLIPCPDGTMADPSVGCVSTPASIAPSSSSLTEILFGLATPLLYGVMTVATLILIYGGIRYATAMGDEEKLQKSKRLIIWGVSGLVVALLAKIIAGFVSSLLMG